MIETSIVILTKNAGKEFKKVLDMVFNQKYDKQFEVIVIDSGSTDGTLEIAKQYPVRIHRIKPEEFGHGTTRNLGVRLSKGKYVCFLVQDALPKNEIWLIEMVKSLREKGVAGVYSRQIPKKGTTPMETFFLNDKYKSKRIVRKFEKGKKKSMHDIHFSDRSSCMRRDLLLKYPYSEDLVLAEDQEWVKKMLEKGYTIIYEPKSEVYHSHNYGLVKVFKKWFDVGSAFSRIGRSESSTGFLISQGLGYYAKEMWFLIRKYPLWVPYAIVYMTLSSYLGILLENKRGICPCG
jgi:rhamnosyltransferase